MSEPKYRTIKRRSAMKEATTWQKIKNGIKRVITFVIDILLFIPRSLFYGISNELTYLACKYIVTEPDYDDGL